MLVTGGGGAILIGSSAGGVCFGSGAGAGADTADCFEDGSALAATSPRSNKMTTEPSERESPTLTLTSFTLPE